MSRRRYRALWSPREGIEVFVDTSEPGVVFVDWIRYRRARLSPKTSRPVVIAGRNPPPRGAA